jgi:phospholipid transport system substrate-binding protein
MLDNTAREFIEQLEFKLKEAKNNDPKNKQAFRQTIRDSVLPMVDKKYFAYKTLGSHLKKMSNEQKTEYVDSLEQTLINSYASILMHYNNERLLLQQIKMADSGKLAKVIVSAIPQDGVHSPTRNIVLSWRYNKEIDNWRIYDFQSDGISLLQSKQKEISSIISKHGIDGLNNRLRKVETVSEKQT